MSFRKEEKLKIHRSQLPNLLDWIYKNDGSELYTPRIVSSTYFDNDLWSMFSESEEGSVPRKKIRIRSYSREPHSQDDSSFEIKTSSIEGRYKTITQSFNLQKIMSLGIFDQDYGVCKPRVRITYKRTYYRIFGVRLTIDKNIEYQATDGHRSSIYKIMDEEIAVELKAAESVPIEYLMERFPFERIRFSKYSKAVNCINENRSKNY